MLSTLSPPSRGFSVTAFGDQHDFRWDAVGAVVWLTGAAIIIAGPRAAA
ncbi:MAG: hypothetical protein OXR03_21960 [Rhodospirillaceae bacterium]|nr:hypothetical protein [Rhodospirillaceae bacterium]